MEMYTKSPIRSVEKRTEKVPKDARVRVSERILYVSEEPVLVHEQRFDSIVLRHNENQSR